jgi:hypothetical protein
MAEGFPSQRNSSRYRWQNRWDIFGAGMGLVQYFHEEANPLAIYASLNCSSGIQVLSSTSNSPSLTDGNNHLEKVNV